jgi:hypothetical protein
MLSGNALKHTPAFISAAFTRQIPYINDANAKSRPSSWLCWTAQARPPLVHT